MDSSIPDNGFTLTIKSRDTANQITVQNGEDLQTARQLLNYHARKTLDQTLSSDNTEPTEIDIHPHLELDSATTEQLKTTIQQLQTQVENTIPADEINSFQDAFSQELEKLRNRISQLETNEPDNEKKWGLDKVDTPESDEEPEKGEQNHHTPLEQFRENHTTSERYDKIYETIKEHGPITRSEIGQELFGKEIASDDREYGEISSYWPNTRVEVADTDGRKKYYQAKTSEEDDSTNEPEHTSKCKECGEQFHGDIDEVDEKLDQHYEDEHQEDDEECDCPTNEHGGKTHNESCPKVQALAENNGNENEAEEEEDELDYPELETTDYTKTEFNDLTVNQRSEVIIRTLLQHQPCTLNTVCNQIFTSGTEPPEDKIRHFLENYWKEIIVHEVGEDGEYSVVSGVNHDPDTASLSALANVWRTGQYWSCLDCDETYEARSDAKTHRQNHGHLNWGFTTGGQLVEQYRENNRKQQKAGGQSA
ncbi:hypothetical protein [Halococcus sediminicola]|uniref:hypothetical protein n=1 Tax=Halococcus sediminicola TaxID=1264579 RepID=UPI0006796954|nr:hypothetical protein [Halococcus sediminicola]